MLSYQTHASGKFASRWKQTKVYIGKLFRIFVSEKDWKIFPMAAVVSILVAMVCVNVYKNMEGTSIGALAISCVCIWNGFFSSIQSVCRERAIIKREHRSGLYLSSYLLAHMIYQAFLCAIQVIIQLIVYLIFASINPRSIYFPDTSLITGSFLIDFSITLFLISYAADMCALMISCIVRSTTSAMTVVPFLLIVQLLFSGVAFELSGSMEIVGNFTIAKWGIRTLCTIGNYNSLPSMTMQAAINQLQTVPELTTFIQALQKTSVIKVINQESTLMSMSSEYAFTNANIWKEWGVLLLMACIFVTIGRISLQFIDKDKR